MYFDPKQNQNVYISWNWNANFYSVNIKQYNQQNPNANVWHKNKCVYIASIVCVRGCDDAREVQEKTICRRRFRRVRTAWEKFCKVSAGLDQLVSSILAELFFLFSHVITS